MKIKFLLSLLFVAFSVTASYASFPVVKTSTAATTSISSNDQVTTTLTSPAAAVKGYDKWVAVAFWFFLGWPFAAHRWYAKKPVGWNILYILTIGGLGIWAIIDLINILTDNFEN